MTLIADSNLIHAFSPKALLSVEHHPVDYMNYPYLNSHLRKESVNCQGPNRLFLLFQPTKHVPSWQNLPKKKTERNFSSFCPNYSISHNQHQFLIIPQRS